MTDIYPNEERKKRLNRIYFENIVFESIAQLFPHLNLSFFNDIHFVLDACSNSRFWL